MSETGKNKWVDGAMNSLEGMQRATPGGFLYKRIEGRLQVKAANRIIPLRTVSVAAACIALLITANIVLISKQKVTHANAIEEVASYYQLTNNNPLENL